MENIFKVDDTILMTLGQLIEDNEGDPLTEQEIEDLKNMSAGEVCWLNKIHIKKVR